MNKKDLILATLFTGNYDVNRSQTLPHNDFSIIESWYNSIVDLKLKAILFHNTYSEATIATYQNEYVTFVTVAPHPIYNANIYRYFIYLNYLNNNIDSINNIFVTDSTDVTVLKNPFIQPQYVANTNNLFCGDEATTLNCNWMIQHHTHLRNNIENFETYELKYANNTLLNCGIIGGRLNVMLLLLEHICSLHLKYSSTNHTLYTLDMGVFNYVANTTFANKVIHGTPINTVFKAYDMESAACWFRHK